MFLGGLMYSHFPLASWIFKLLIFNSFLHFSKNCFSHVGKINNRTCAIESWNSYHLSSQSSKNSEAVLIKLCFAQSHARCKWDLRHQYTRTHYMHRWVWTTATSNFTAISTNMKISNTSIKKNIFQLLYCKTF